jgi:hypothetical protein
MNSRPFPCVWGSGLVLSLPVSPGRQAFFRALGLKTFSAAQAEQDIDAVSNKLLSSDSIGVCPRTFNLKLLRIIMKKTILALFVAPYVLTACGDSSSDDSSVASRQKKHVVVCDGVVFDNAQAFVKRKEISASGTRTYKPGTFDANKEKDELRKVATALRQQCNGAYTIVNISICDQIDVVNTDLAFHTMEHSVNGYTYKGSYSCNLKEKQ